MSRFSQLALVIGLAIGLSACEGAGPTTSAVDLGVPDTGQAPAAARSLNRAYVLGPGDRLNIKVYNEPELTGEYEVGAGGRVSLPLAGEVNASGLTTQEFERALTAKLAAGIVRDPRVSAEIATYRPFYILGEVRKSGEYPYRVGLTVLDAVATAGGFTYRANERTVYIRRAGAATEEAVNLAASVPVFPGDNIRIAERFF